MYRKVVLSWFFRALPVLLSQIGPFMGYYTNHKRRFYGHYFDIGAAAEPVSGWSAKGAMHLRFTGEIFSRRNQQWVGQRRRQVAFSICVVRAHVRCS